MSVIALRQQVLSLAVLASIVAAGGAEVARGQIAEWTNPLGGVFTDPNNWSPFPPGPTSMVSFAEGSAYSVEVFSNTATGSATIQNGNVTWNLGAGGLPATYTINGTINFGAGSPTLNVAGGNVAPTSVFINSGGSDSSAVLNVSGAGATVAQTSALTVGHATIGTATLNVSNGGTYTTGTGLTQVNPTGLINVSGSSSTFNALGDLTINGGSIVRTGGAFNLANGKNVQILNGGELNLGNQFLITANNDIHISGSGSIFSSAGPLINGGSQLVALGGGSSVSDYLEVGNTAAPGGNFAYADGGSSLVVNGTVHAGRNGGYGAMRFSNGSTGSFQNLRMADNGVAGSEGILEVFSGSNVQVSSAMELGTGGLGEASLTVFGNFTKLGTNPINLGHASTGTAEIVVQAGGIFASGNSPINVAPTGEIHLKTGGTLDAQAPINMNGGAFNFLGGVLRANTFNGNLVNQGGTLAPGHSAGTTTVAGDYTQQLGSKLQIEIGGTTSVDNDFLNVTGTASLGGKLELHPINDFQPTVGQTFTILQAGGPITGAFSNVASGQRLPTIDGSGSFLVEYGPGSDFPDQVRLSEFQTEPGLLAYEPFAYAAGTNLAGAVGGNGFAGPWVGSPHYVIGQDTLTAYGLGTWGNRVTGASTLVFQEIKRELSIPLGVSDTTRYLSFLIRRESSSGFFGIELIAPTFDHLFVGKPNSGAVNYVVMEHYIGEGQRSSGYPLGVGETVFVIVQADFYEGEDVFTLYVNGHVAVKSDIDVGLVESLRIVSDGAFSLDELRIGTSFEDVSVAMPGDFNLDGTVDAADYVLWRKTDGAPDTYHWVWRFHFGESRGSGSASPIDQSSFISAPEPTGVVLLLLAALAGSMNERWMRSRSRCPGDRRLFERSL